MFRIYKSYVFMFSFLFAFEAVSQVSSENAELSIQPELLQSIEEAVRTNPDIFDTNGKVTDTKRLSQILLYDSALSGEAPLREMATLKELELLAEKFNNGACRTCLPNEPGLSPKMPIDPVSPPPGATNCYLDLELNAIICPEDND